MSKEGFQRVKADLIEANPALQFLFDRMEGLLEYLWEEGVQEGRAELLAEQQVASDQWFQHLNEERRRAGNQW